MEKVNCSKLNFFSATNKRDASGSTSPWRVKMSFCSRLFYNRHHPPILSCFTNTGREPMVVIHVPYLGRYKEQFGVRAVRPPSNTYIYICIEKYRRNHINVQPAYVAIHYYVYVTFKLYISDVFLFRGEPFSSTIFQRHFHFDQYWIASTLLDFFRKTKRNSYYLFFFYSPSSIHI